MKKITLIFYFSFLILNYSFAQNPGEWIWINGDTSYFQPTVVYGTQGVPSPLNHPTGLYEACFWTDLNGKFWLYGGVDGLQASKSDLWKYDPLTNQWAWIRGAQTDNYTGNYGSIGVPSPSNHPPSKGWGTPTWTDLNGNLWMFGGLSTLNGVGRCSDLWKYDIVTNEWTWMKGPNTINDTGHYGIQGVPDIANNPRSRQETTAAWTDASGDLWMFGGLGGGIGGGILNDVWRYNIATNTWTWMKGSTVEELNQVIGTIGVEDSANSPFGRYVFAHWKDSNGNFWIQGGYYKSISISIALDDLWRYNPNTNNWTCIHNSNPSSGTICLTAPNNIPSRRFENTAAWTDTNGNFWMFGGAINITTSLSGHNNLWIYCLSNQQWTWASYDTLYGDHSGYWGTMGVPNSHNRPEGRAGSAAWRHNDELYLFGGLPNYVNFFAFNDMWKFKIDTTCYNCYLTTEITEPSTPKEVISIFFDGSDNIEVFLAEIIQNGEIAVFNMLGEKIYTSAFNGNRQTINCRMSKGIYFVSLTDVKGNKITSRFMKL